MARLPYTKFQDFYLRLGFLKVLVAVLNPQRRSAMNDQIVRRLESPLFDAAPRHAALHQRIKTKITWYPRKTAGGKLVEFPETAEALLVDAPAESVLYGITRDTAYKVLDWARDIEFVGRGNQITERALLLRRLIPDDKSEAFLSGDVDAWNPFLLSVPERLFFLFHLIEIDRVTVELIEDLANLAPDEVVESLDAARLTCHAMFRVLNDAADKIEPRDIPAYRTARELACTIAGELDLAEYEDACRSSTRRRVPKPMKLTVSHGGMLSRSSSHKPRKTTKNADHQTIPRFEQLVDLGFLVKPSEDRGDTDERVLAGRRRWKYIPTPACRRWAAASRRARADSPPFKWHGFARAAVAAFAGQQNAGSREADEAVVANYLWRAYKRVGREMGHTPADSVALFGMLMAAEEGRVVEMTDFHDLLRDIKQKSEVPDFAFFASGNELDTMFIQLKPGFLEHLREARHHALPDHG